MSMDPCALPPYTLPVPFTDQGPMLKSVVLCALPCHTSPVFKGALRSLLSSVEYFHKAYLFIPLGSRQGLNFMDKMQIIINIFLMMYSSLT